MTQIGVRRCVEGLGVVITGVLLALILVLSLAHAELVGPEIAVSTNTYDQQNPHTIYLPDKNLWFVVWEDWRNRTTGADIYGRFIKADGTFCGSEIPIAQVTGNQTAPRAAYRNAEVLDPGNNSILMIVWQDTRFSKTAAPIGGFVYYRSINVAGMNADTCVGAVLSSESVILFQNDALVGPASYTVNSRSLPKVAYDVIEDRFFLAWVESRTIRKTINYNPFPFPGMTSEANLAFGDTQFIGYAALRGDGTGYETLPSIISQVQDPTGTFNFTRATLLEAFSGPFDSKRKYEFFDKVANVDLACDTTAAECFIAWEGLRGVVDLVHKCEDKEPQQPLPPAPPIPNRGYCYLEDIIKVEVSQVTYAPYIGIYGLHEKDIDINVGAAQISQGNAQAHYPAAGFSPVFKRFLVCWEDMRICRNGETACPDPVNALPNKKVMCQLIASGSGQYQTNFIVSYQDTNSDGKQDDNLLNSEQSRPQISYDSVNQRFFVAWQDGRNTGLSLENLDIYGQRVDPDGSRRGSNYAVSTLAHNQLAPTLAYNDYDDLYLVAWKDARDTDRYSTNNALCNGAPRFVGRSCGSQIYGQRFSVAQSSITLLNPDNTALAPPLLKKFENPAGSGRVDVGLFATQAFKIRSTGSTLLKIDYIDPTCGGTFTNMGPFSFDGLPSQLASRGGSTLDLVPSAEITLTVRFQPEEEGSFNRCFIIESDGGNLMVNLSAMAVEAVIVVTPTSGAFGDVYIGSSKEQSFTVRNNGLATLKISSLTNPSSPFSISTEGCSGKNLAPGEACGITAKFTPSAVGAASSQFAINSNDPDPADSPLIIPLNGNGLGAQDITVTPLAVNFGNVQVNQSRQQTIAVKNDGTAALAISSVSTPAAPFSRTTDCGASLAAGTSCQITVTFQPTATGGVGGFINIISDDPDEGTVRVDLSGTGVVTPDIQVNSFTTSPVAVNFPNTPVNSTTTQTVTVVNVGSTNLTISYLTNPTGEFSISGSTCAGTLAPASNCVVTVSFTPTSSGFKQTSFAINSNDPDTPVFTINLFGTGAIAPNIEVIPPAYNFGTKAIGTVTDQDIAVKNTGTAVLSIASVTGPALPFSMVSNGCPANLAVNATCTIKVRFAPTVAGPFSGSVVIASNDPDSPSVTVTVTGTGGGAPDIQVSPQTAVNFEATLTGGISIEMITVRNAGSSNLVISSICLDGELCNAGATDSGGNFGIVSSTCVGTHVPAAACTITVAFSPKSAGFKQAPLWINSNDPDTPRYELILTGSSALVLLNMDNSPLAPPILNDFENPAGTKAVKVGLSDSQSFKLRNVGDKVMKVDYVDVNLPCNAIREQLGSGNGVAATFGSTLTAAPILAKSVFVTDGIQECSDNGSGGFSGSGCVGGTVNYTTGFIAVTFTAPPLNGSSILVEYLSTQQNPLLPFNFNGLQSELSTRGGGAIFLSPGADLVFTVRFAPTAMGSYSRCFAIETDAGKYQVSLSGFATAPNIVATPTSFNIGSVSTGGYADAIFKVGNDGTAPLVVDKVSNPAVPFSIQSNSCNGASVNPGGTCEVKVRFAPTAAGTFTSQITIYSDDSDTPTVAIALTGTGQAAPNIVVNPTTVEFGNVEVNQSVDRVISVSNSGIAVLNITSISSPVAPFSRTATTCGGTLSAGGSCTITVRFSPTSSGAVSSSLSITTNDPDTPSVSVTLNGAGVSTPNIVVNPTTVNFGSVSLGSSSQVPVDVRNTGSATLNITDITPPSGDFAIAANTCTSTLAAGTACTITVRFTPAGQASSQSTLVISSNDPDSPRVTVALTGNGTVVPPNIIVSPMTIDFGNVRRGATSAPRTVDINNETGAGMLTISSITYPGAPFNVTSNTCGTSGTLAPGARCQITIVFNPTRAVLYSPYYLTISSNDPDTPQVRVTLRGRGTN